MINMRIGFDENLGEWFCFMKIASFKISNRYR